MTSSQLDRVAREIVAELIRTRKERPEAKREWTRCSIRRIAAEVLTRNGLFASDRTPYTENTVHWQLPALVYRTVLSRTPKRRLPAQFYIESESDTAC